MELPDSVIVNLVEVSEGAIQKLNYLLQTFTAECHRRLARLFPDTPIDALMLWYWVVGLGNLAEWQVNDGPVNRVTRRLTEKQKLDAFALLAFLDKVETDLVPAASSEATARIALAGLRAGVCFGKSWGEDTEHNSKALSRARANKAAKAKNRHDWVRGRFKALLRENNGKRMATCAQVAAEFSRQFEGGKISPHTVRRWCSASKPPS